MSGKIPVLEKKGKKGKSGRGSWTNRSQNPRFPIFSNISQVWFIRFWWNFQGMLLVWKEWRLISLVAWLPILARACLSFQPKLVQKCTISSISRIWFIRFWRNFQGMFLVWRGWRLNSLVPRLPILARARLLFRPKLWPNWSQNALFPVYLEFGSSDFDGTFRECYWYEKNEGLSVWSHDCPFLPGHAYHLGPI